MCGVCGLRGSHSDIGVGLVAGSGYLKAIHATVNRVKTFYLNRKTYWLRLKWRVQPPVLLDYRLHGRGLFRSTVQVCLTLVPLWWLGEMAGFSKRLLVSSVIAFAVGRELVREHIVFIMRPILIPSFVIRNQSEALVR